MNRIKYPRTYHIPWSPGVDVSDKVHSDLSFFEGKYIVVTEKLDGENTSLYSDYIHARSLDSKHHASRSWVKLMHSNIKNQIPEGWRICGENVYAKHSIAYENLESYFYGFSIWNENNICLSWEETKVFFKELGIIPVPEIYHGMFNEEYLKDIAKTWPFETKEGFVVRLSDEFHYDNFKTSVAKFVRSNHITTDEHWMQSQIIKNQLKK